MNRAQRRIHALAWPLLALALAALMGASLLARERIADAVVAAAARPAP